MSDVFGSVYANAYDALYQDKDYAAECDLLECIFEQYGIIPIKKLLDLGCGTGNHAIPLAERGYEVTGVDFSQTMLNDANMKARSKNLPIDFHLEDIKKVNLNRKFDAVLMMFAVLGYQLENADVLAALKVAHNHLRQDGLLIFDIWYGPAVLAHRPSDKIKIISASDKRILRTASGELDIKRHSCNVNYHLWQLRGNMLESEQLEEHKMRFFFPLELEFFLEIAGFNLLRLGIFPEVDKDPDENSWNIIAIARAK